MTAENHLAVSGLLFTRCQHEIMNLDCEAALINRPPLRICIAVILGGPHYSVQAI